MLCHINAHPDVLVPPEDQRNWQDCWCEDDLHTREVKNLYTVGK